MRLAVCFLSVAAFVMAASFAAAEGVPGHVTHVTLYRGQAMIGRTVPVEGPAGGVEIVVGGLPAHIVPESLFAEGNDDAEVRAVRFRTRAVGEEPRQEVRKLDDAIEQAEEILQNSRKGLDLLAKRTKYLDQLEGFVAPTAKTELSKGVLNADALEKITLFSFDQRKTITQEQITLEEGVKGLTKQISLLKRKRAELTQGASRTVHEAVLFLEKHADGKSTVRLNYLVGSCGWSPAYTLRAAADRQQVRIQCSGLVHQMTGEDWSDVELTLSTASPALSAAGPGLAPFPVSLRKDGEGTKLSQRELSSQLQSIRERQGEAIRRNLSAASLDDNIGSSWEVNHAANDYQTLELVSGKDLVNMLRSAETEAREGPSLSYQLHGPVSLASRSDQQMVRIVQTSLKSRFYHVATPVLTGHVYREAELVNTCEKDLLAGPTTVYLNGRFVGRGEIPTVARGQMFVVGFGADPQLRARRELADRTETVQGGNKEIEFKYRLILENYTDQAVPVRLNDRLPHCDVSTDIRITLDEMKDPIDDDVLYLRRERPKGILRWEIDVPPGAIREKARMVEYGFTLEFDRNFNLATSQSGGQQLQLEFEDLERMRALPSAAEEE